MRKFNPCVTGNTRVWTVEGMKTFKELSDNGEDVDVYCLDSEGNMKISRMFHPRLTGYGVDIVNVVLSDGTSLEMTENHTILTDGGYVQACDLCEGDMVAVVKEGIPLPSGIDDADRRFTDYTGTKKGTVIKVCEVTGQEFECIWDEREVCTSGGYEPDMHGIRGMGRIESPYIGYVPVSGVVFTGSREKVYNGTVAVYHNYFTCDENTGTMVNQLNCGEHNI